MPDHVDLYVDLSVKEMRAEILERIGIAIQEFAAELFEVEVLESIRNRKAKTTTVAELVEEAEPATSSQISPADRYRASQLAKQFITNTTSQLEEVNREHPIFKGLTAKEVLAQHKAQDRAKPKRKYPNRAKFTDVAEAKRVATAYVLNHPGVNTNEIIAYLQNRNIVDPRMKAGAAASVTREALAKAIREGVLRSHRPLTYPGQPTQYFPATKKAAKRAATKKVAAIVNKLKRKVAKKRKGVAKPKPAEPTAHIPTRDELRGNLLDTLAHTDEPLTIRFLTNKMREDGFGDPNGDRLSNAVARELRALHNIGKLKRHSDRAPGANVQAAYSINYPKITVHKTEETTST